eukprot:Skav221018  [mRNA]  locus=scaffold2350:400781:403870:- [translate_table: standard]
MTADGQPLARWKMPSKDVYVWVSVDVIGNARVSRYELLMLWRRLDADGSGEVSLDEFVKMMYRYELAMWPRSSDAELSRVVQVVSKAISR